MRIIPWTLVLLLAAVVSEAAAPRKAPNIFESPARPAPVGKLDKIVFSRLSSLGIQPKPRVTGQGAVVASSTSLSTHTGSQP